MSKRDWFSIMAIFMVAVFLLVSCTPRVASITSVTHKPEYPAAGEIVTFFIDYQNMSAEQTLTGAVLEVTYDTDLIVSASDTDPQPDRVAESEHFLVWELGDLPAGQGGSVVVGFFVSVDTPLDKTKLFVNATIHGTTSEGGASSSSGQDITNILGHSTETPIPPPVVEEYQSEGVTVELPWQDSQIAIHSEQQDFNFDQIPVVEGYDIIRPVIYLDIFTEQNEVVNSFSPPITLTVKYTASDIEAAGSEDNIVVLILERIDGQEDRWIPCDGQIMTDKTNCSVVGTTKFSESSGYGTITVQITAWTSGTGLGKR